MTTWGLTPQGFVPARQQDVLDELNAELRLAFGGNLNLGPASVLGQINGIISERIALLWEALEDVYQSQYPSGAEGVAVDNILALNGLVRRQASPTVTNPATTVQPNGVPLYGLVLGGTPGTVIPAGSLIKTAIEPPLTFALDAAVSIGASADSVQTLVFSNTPSTGTFALAFEAESGAILTTAPIAYNAQTKAALVRWATAPTSGTYRLALGRLLTAPIAYNAAASAVQAAVRALTGYEDTVVASAAGGFAITWAVDVPPVVSARTVLLTFSAPPTVGTYTLTLAGQATAPIPFGADATALQAAVRGVTAFARTEVIGDVANGFTLIWGLATPPSVSVSANTTGVSISVNARDTVNQPTQTINSLQATIAATYDAEADALPLTDVGVTGSGNSRTLTFGAHPPLEGQPSTGDRPQARVVVASNSLLAGGTQTNINVIYAQSGARAQGIGSATCTASGPNFIAAGGLSVIGSPTTGWTSVTNQLDCLSGSNLESDTDALARFSASRAIRASGSLQAILDKVAALAQVEAVIGFQNLTGAAHQLIEFETVPSAGAWALALGDDTTASLAFNASGAQVQAALAALPGLDAVKVTGVAGKTYDVDFNGAMGGQAMDLLRVVNNTTATGIWVAYGQPPKSFQVVVEGGTDVAVAGAIAASAPAGISTYGAPVARTIASVTAGSASLTVANAQNIAVGLAAFGSGLRSGVTVASVAGNDVVLSAPAIGTYGATRVAFGYSVEVRDTYNNPQLIAFSRPEQVLIYVQISLITDTYNTPGDSASGLNSVATFKPQSISSIQKAIIDLGNNIGIGGLIVAQGSNGLIGAFNAIDGIVDYELTFGPAPNPTNTENIRLLPGQVALLEEFNTEVSFV